MQGELKNKMYDYEVAPPQALWNTIEAELQEQEAMKPLAKKMAAWEVKPPAAVWRAIRAALSSPTPVKVIPFRKIYRIAAAAVVLVAGGWYFLNHSDTARRIAHGSSVAGIPGPGSLLKDAYTNEDNDNQAYASPVKLAVAAHYSRPQRYAAYEESSILPVSYVEDASPFTDDQISVTARPILTASGELIQDRSIVNPDKDGYIIVTAPNGQQTKVSSKLISAIPYLSTGSSASDKAGSWQQRVHEWRNKILSSGFAPSSSNFLDILEFTDMVEEEEDQDPSLIQ